jgi:hypothetical protein
VTQPSWFHARQLWCMRKPKQVPVLRLGTSTNLGPHGPNLSWHDIADTSLDSPIHNMWLLYVAVYSST